MSWKGFYQPTRKRHYPLPIASGKCESESVFCSHRCLRGLKLVSAPGKWRGGGVWFLGLCRGLWFAGWNILRGLQPGNLESLRPRTWEIIELRPQILPTKVGWRRSKWVDKGRFVCPALWQKGLIPKQIRLSKCDSLPPLRGKFPTHHFFFPSNGILTKTENCNRVINILTASIAEEQQNYAKNNKPISGRTS